MNLRFPDVKTIGSLTHRPPFLPGSIPGTHFCLKLSRPQVHSAAGKSVLMKNSNDTIENRTRDLQTCNTVSHPTALRRAPQYCTSVYCNYNILAVMHLLLLINTRKFDFPNSKPLQGQIHTTELPATVLI
jgi:hypothetical protein